MPITRAKKEEIVADLSQELAQRPVTIFVEFSKIPVAEQRALRAQLKQVSGRMVVAKKTLARIAFLKAGLPVNPEDFPSSLALVFADDLVSVAQKLRKFARRHESFVILSGMFREREADKVSVFSQDEMKRIAELPSRQVLLGEFARVLAMPLRNLVSVLSAPSRNLVVALEQYSLGALKGQK